MIFKTTQEGEKVAVELPDTMLCLLSIEMLMHQELRRHSVTRELGEGQP